MAGRQSDAKNRRSEEEEAAREEAAADCASPFLASRRRGSAGAPKDADGKRAPGEYFAHTGTQSECRQTSSIGRLAHADRAVFPPLPSLLPFPAPNSDVAQQLVRVYDAACDSEGKTRPHQERQGPAARARLTMRTGRCCFAQPTEAPTRRLAPLRPNPSEIRLCTVHRGKDGRGKRCAQLHCQRSMEAAAFTAHVNDKARAKAPPGWCSV